MKPKAKLSVMLTVCGALTMAMTVSGLNPAVAHAASVTNITDWSWVPNGQMGVAGFEKVDPSVHIDLTNVGAGSAEYTKLSTALAAGSGAPCIAQVEYDHLPAYEAKPGLVNIAAVWCQPVQDRLPGLGMATYEQWKCGLFPWPGHRPRRVRVPARHFHEVPLVGAQNMESIRRRSCHATQGQP